MSWKRTHKLIIHPEYKTILISNKPRLTLGDLILYVASYPHKEDLFRETFDKWKRFKLSHLLTLYIQIYLRNAISKQFKYDNYVDKYYANIPTVSYIQQNYKPYLDHIITQIDDDLNQDIFMYTQTFRSLVQNKLEMYMNKPILYGPILTLSMHKKDLFVFGFIHRFQHENNFHAQVIPWDVIKLIHSFFDKINKEYLEKFENIKRSIIEIESQIYDLKHNPNHVAVDRIHEKQYELLTLYNKSKDIQCQERYFPHLIDEYVINTQRYTLTAKEFAFKIKSIPLTSFTNIYAENSNPNWMWGQSLNVVKFLEDLLNEITPKHLDVIKENKKSIQQQIDIYDDYIKLKMSPAADFILDHDMNSKTVYQNITNWILEIFCKENEWSKRIIKRAKQFNKRKNTKLKSSQYKYYSVDNNVNRTGKSFTID